MTDLYTTDEQSLKQDQIRPRYEITKRRKEKERGTSNRFVDRSLFTTTDFIGCYIPPVWLLIREMFS